MTKDQVTSVAYMYRENLKGLGFSANEETYDATASEAPIPHLIWMCEQLPNIAQHDMEKACRWLGFVQGVLWTRGIYPISEMMNHNRSR